MHSIERLLIKKYLLKEATEEEVKVLFDWVDASSENKDVFIEYKKFWALSVESNVENNLAWQEVRKKINNLKRKKRVSLILKYAAVFLVGISIAASLFMNKTEEEREEDQNEIVLELDDGTKQIISDEDTQDIVNHDGSVLGKQQESKISYENSDLSDDEKLVYNTLYVPYAKRFHIVLSDGSSVHLNAGSTIKFPVKFLKDTPREVFLDGEAFFEVSEDKQNTFIVRANGLSTHVYGTKFNVNSYKNDDSEEVVLVEGSVGVKKIGKNSNTTEELFLKPNEKVSLDKTGQMQKQAVDVTSHVAWVDGVLHFKNERLENILKKLERYYDVSIQNNYKVISDNRYTGIFDGETLDEILKTFSRHQFFAYKINEKQVIINP